MVSASHVLKSLTCNEGILCSNFCPRLGHCRMDNEKAVHGSPQPVGVSMPEECSALAGHCELIDLGASDLQGALGYMSCAVCPVRPKLEYSMPAKPKYFKT